MFNLTDNELESSIFITLLVFVPVLLPTPLPVDVVRTIFDNFGGC